MTHLAKIISISAKNVGTVNIKEYVFSPNGGRLILKGGNGEGKTTFQDTLKLGTGGSTIVNREYIDEKLLLNAFIADGDNRVAVTVKHGKNGLYYALKGYDAAKQPIGEIDGVKLTAGSYLKMMYDPMITKVADFCSEDRTRARNCHTELFADKLGKIEIDQLIKDLKEAREDMQYKERLRNTVEYGFRGTDEFLKTKGVDWKRPDTYPPEQFENLESKKIELMAEKSRLKSAPKQERIDKMNALESEMKLIAEKVKNYNNGIDAKEKERKVKKDARIQDFELAEGLCQTIESSFSELVDLKLFSVDKLSESSKMLGDVMDFIATSRDNLNSTFDPIPSKIQYDQNDKVDVEKTDNLTDEAKELLADLQNRRVMWGSLYNSNQGDQIEIETPEIDQKLAQLEVTISEQKEQKGLRKALDAFFSWQDARDKVTELKSKIAAKYASIDTGIDGLEFKYDDTANKTDMYYDGTGFDFFKKLHGNPKRVTALSETERALLCLMVQFKRMSERAKAINLTYIDCSITQNSYECIEQALARYGLKDVYVVASQACDVTKEQLNDCDVLIEGGEIFFNGQRSEEEEGKVIETKY